MEKISRIFFCVCFSTLLLCSCTQVTLPDDPGSPTVTIEISTPTVPAANKTLFLLDPIILTTENGTHQTTTIESSVAWDSPSGAQLSFHVAATSLTNYSSNTIRIIFYSTDAETGEKVTEKFVDLSTPSNNTDNAKGIESIYLIAKVNFPELVTITKVDIIATSGDYQLVIQDAVITPMSAPFLTEEVTNSANGILLITGSAKDPAVFGTGGITNSGSVEYLLTATLFIQGNNGLVPVMLENPVTYQVVSGPSDASVTGNVLTVPLQTGKNQVQVTGLTTYQSTVITATFSTVLVKNTPPSIVTLIAPPSTYVNFSDIPAGTVIAKFRFDDTDLLLGQGLTCTGTCPSWCSMILLASEDGSKSGCEVITKTAAPASKNNTITVSVNDSFETATASIGPFTISPPTYSFDAVDHATIGWSQHSGGSYPIYYLMYDCKIRLKTNVVDEDMVAWIAKNCAPITGQARANRYTDFSYPVSSAQIEAGAITVSFTGQEEYEFYHNSSSGVGSMSYQAYFGSNSIISRSLGLCDYMVLRWGSK